MVRLARDTYKLRHRLYRAPSPEGARSAPGSTPSAAQLTTCGHWAIGLGPQCPGPKHRLAADICYRAALAGPPRCHAPELPRHSERIQPDDRCSPTALVSGRELESVHGRIPLQQRVHHAPEDRPSLAMYDPDAQHVLLSTGPQVLRHHRACITRGKGMQVQNAIDRVLNRVVHGNRTIGLAASFFQRIVGTHGFKVTQVEIRFLSNRKTI